VIKIDREKLLESLPDRLGITPEKCATLILRESPVTRPSL
jgi:hypothetical protein